ncbi:MAG: tRNA pseudouridine65 synthase [Kiritimatiellia bacterium]
MSDALLNILFRDETLIAVDKPCGLLVHPGREPEDKCWIAMKVLRDQLGQRVYTIHRLDRPTSGVLLYSLDEPTADAMRALFEARQVRKQYLAVVRGCAPEHWENETPLQKSPEEKIKASRTTFRRLAHCSSGTFPLMPDLDLSLVEAQPYTGRHHQIRRHLAMDGFPILGDYLYAEVEDNDRMAAATGITRMMLLAQNLSFVHPYTGEPISITAPLPDAFKKVAAGSPA